MPTKTPTKAEQEKFLAEAEAARAKAENERVLTEGSRLENEALQIELERTKYNRAKELAKDEHHHIYRFNSAVGESTVKSCMEQLAAWHRMEAQCGITIVFCSPGGDIISGLALFDYIQELRAAGHYVTTKALGMAASMAGILLQAGDKRVMSAESWLLIHEAQFGTVGSFGEVEDRVEWIRQLQKRIVKIFACRSKLSERQIERKWHRKDWWMSSDEALKHGLVDEVDGELNVG